MRICIWYRVAHAEGTPDSDDVLYEPFSYRHLGSLVYISNAAAFDFNGFNLAGGLAAMYLWRSVYLYVASYSGG